MKYLNQILATLLAIPYIVFVLNYFYPFLPMPEMTGDIGTFFKVFYTSHFLLVIKVLELVLGAALITNFKRPLALILITPITVGIFLTEILVQKEMGLGIIMLIINVFLLYRYKEHYKGFL